MSHPVLSLLSFVMISQVDRILRSGKGLTNFLKKNFSNGAEDGIYRISAERTQIYDKLSRVGREQLERLFGLFSISLKGKKKKALLTESLCMFLCVAF